MEKCFAAIVLWCLGGTCVAQTGPAPPEANPGRPTVTTPATLTPVGYVQFETGAFGAQHSPEFRTRKSLSEAVKLAVHKRLQLLFLAEPIVRAAEGARQTAFGDASAGFQAVMLEGERARPTIAFSYLRQVRDSGLPEVDFGSPVHSAVLLASNDFLGFHADANAMFNELTIARVRRAQFGQTLSVSHPVKGFTVSGEIWHFTQPFLGGNAVGNLWGVSYPIRPNLVVDAAFNHGLTSTSTRWEALFGFTYLLPHRLWTKR
jgi:hypothetical protein